MHTSTKNKPYKKIISLFIMNTNKLFLISLNKNKLSRIILNNKIYPLILNIPPHIKHRVSY